jgi:hypothetical protein
MLRIKNLKPMFTGILTTGEKFKADATENGIIVNKSGDLKLYQTVLAVGSSVRDVKKGDKVMINPSAYVMKKYSKDSIQNDMDNNPILSINIPTVIVDDEKGNPRECLLITDRDIQFVFEGEEENNPVILPKNKLIIS